MPFTRSELLERSKELPNIYRSVVEAVRHSDVATAREMYSAFVGFNTNNPASDLLSIIKEIRES